jgi:SAM-dependent methyltransferase
MKRIGVILLVIVLHISAFGQQVPGDPNADSEIREQTKHYFDAIENGDVKTLDDLLVEEFLVYYPRGIIGTKASWLEAVRKPIIDGRPIESKSTMSEVKVRRIDDTAILTTMLTTKYENAPSVSKRRTLIWIRQNGHWRLMHDQWSLIGDAGEAEFWSDYFRGNNQNFNRKPNLLLTKAIEKVTPGKALDVGMGEGRNAIYLAKLGWEVTGIDRAEGALALARQQAIEQGVKITPILQTAEEFDWNRERWDLVALIYFNAVRQNIAKVRESLRPGGLVVVEAFLAPTGSLGRGVEYEPGELRKLFTDGFEIISYEEAEGIADYGQKRKQLVRLVGSRTMTQALSSGPTLQPNEIPSDDANTKSKSKSSVVK